MNAVLGPTAGTYVAESSGISVIGVGAQLIVRIALACWHAYANAAALARDCVVSMNIPAGVVNDEGIGHGHDTVQV